jgi:hypothetical protein
MTNERDLRNELSGPSAGATTAAERPDASALVRGLLDGDAKSWAALRRTHERELRKRLKRFLSNQKALPSDAVDDIIQSLYVRLLRADRRILRSWLASPRVPFDAVLWWIAKGLAKDEVKAARYRGTRSIDDVVRGDDDNDDGDGAEAWFEKGRGAAFVAAERANRSDIDGMALAFRGELVERAVISRHGAALASCGWLPTEGRARRAFFAALERAVLVMSGWDREVVYAWFGGPEAFVIDKHGRRIDSFVVSKGATTPSIRAARSAMKIRRVTEAERHALRERHRDAQLAVAA